MRHGLVRVSLALVLMLGSVLMLIAPLPTAAGDTAVQYVQVSTHAAMTINGQTITIRAAAPMTMKEHV